MLMSPVVGYRYFLESPNGPPTGQGDNGYYLEYLEQGGVSQGTNVKKIYGA